MSQSTEKKSTQTSKKQKVRRRKVKDLSPDELDYVTSLIRREVNLIEIADQLNLHKDSLSAYKLNLGSLGEVPKVTLKKKDPPKPCPECGEISDLHNISPWINEPIMCCFSCYINWENDLLNAAYEKRGTSRPTRSG